MSQEELSLIRDQNKLLRDLIDVLKRIQGEQSSSLARLNYVESTVSETSKRLNHLSGAVGELVRGLSLKRQEPLKVENPMLAKTIRGIPFYGEKIYQWKEIAAGDKAIVWRYHRGNLHWGAKDVALIYYLGNAWFTNTFIRWYIDDYLKEKLERQIAAVNTPLRLEVPFLAEHDISFEAVNNDTASHKFEVLCDGIIIDAESAKKIVSAPAIRKL